MKDKEAILAEVPEDDAALDEWVRNARWVMDMEDGAQPPEDDD